MKSIQDFKSSKMDLKKIQGGTYGNPIGSVEIIGYNCPCEGTVNMSTGEITENQGTPIYSFDEGSYY